MEIDEEPIYSMYLSVELAEHDAVSCAHPAFSSASECFRTKGREHLHQFHPVPRFHTHTFLGYVCDMWGMCDIFDCILLSFRLRVL